MKRRFALAAIAAVGLVTSAAAQLPYRIVDTGQRTCYDTSAPIAPPAPGQPFFGQDAQFDGAQPAYRDNGDGTVTDLVTGLMWVKARGTKMTFEQALAGADTCTAGGHDDWRMPTIKELYSLIDFNGYVAQTESASTPFLDRRYFEFVYGNTAVERIIDCQDWSATVYRGLTMLRDSTVFGVNFADGRIKGYPLVAPGGAAALNRLYVRYVRGNSLYGRNLFIDNGAGTITDAATGLMWSQADSREGMDWPEALAWVQARNDERYLGYADWRLPNAKELQSIVDYSRSPSETGSPAIDPVFETTMIDGGEYPFYWTGTTHLDGPPENRYGQAVYICFGRGLGWMQFPPASEPQLVDVHGAGSQRSDPKQGDASQFPHGRGPQGDVIRIDNFVRLVRGGGSTSGSDAHTAPDALDLTSR